MNHPHNHGLLSAINAYLLFVPILNFGIAQYDRVYTETITDLCTRGVLPVSPRDIFSVFTGAQAKAAVIFSFLVSFALAVIAVWWSSVRNPGNTWLSLHRRPRSVSYYFHFAFFFVELGIVFDWFLRHILIWFRLNQLVTRARPDPFSPDHMLGLGGMADLTFWSFFVFAVLTFLVEIWLYGNRITLSKTKFTSNPGHLFATATILILGGVGVLLTLLTTHELLRKAQHQTLVAVSSEVSGVCGRIRDELKSPVASEQPLKALLLRWDAGDRLYSLVQSSSTWPVSPSAPGLITPVFLPVLIEAIKKLATKMSIFKTGEA